MAKPYTGITGFMERGEIVNILSDIPDVAGRLIMVGVLASSKTLGGKTNKYPNRFPKIGMIPRIFQNDQSMLNLIHYSTDDPETLDQQLLKLAEIGGKSLHGFQLNIAWPDPKVVELLSVNRALVIVLQVGSYAMRLVDNSPEKLADKINDEYRGIVDYVLLDPSGGRGQPFDVEDIKRYLWVLKNKVDVGLAVAGGLNADNLEDLVGPLVKDFPDISINAEGQLRDANDRLDPNKSVRYLLNGLKLLGEI